MVNTYNTVDVAEKCDGQRTISDVIMRDAVDDKNEKRRNGEIERRQSRSGQSERLTLTSNRQPTTSCACCGRQATSRRRRDATPYWLHQTSVTNRAYTTYRLRGEIMAHREMIIIIIII